MTAIAKDRGLLVQFRPTNTIAGVTRDTVKSLAARLGFNETQTIHFALAKLAREVLPSYEPDDGALSKKEIQTIHQLAPQDRPFKATKSLF
jgi:hypothetical protein